MAAPNPERERKRLDQLLEGGKSAPGLPACLVLSGASDFFRQEAVDAALAAVPERAELRSIDGDQGSDGREFDDLRGGSLFGSGTVVVVRRGEAWLKSHGDALLAVLPRLRAGNSLILEVKKLDGRTKLAKSLAAAGEVFEFRDLYTEPYDRSRGPLEAEIVGWLVARSRAMRCPLQPEAALLLVSTVGSQPAELVAEVERIRAAVGERRQALSVADLRGSVTCSFESNPFELADALLAFDRRGATRALTAMYARGTRSRDGARIDQAGLFPFVSGWLYQSLAQLHEGRAALDRGVPLRDVAKEVGVRVFADRFTAQVQNNPLLRLRRGLELLHRCQRELRSAVEDPHYLLLAFLGRYFDEPAA